MVSTASMKPPSNGMRCLPAVLISCPLASRVMARRGGLRPQGLDQSLELGVIRLDLGELLGIAESSGVIPRVAVEADERRERVAIPRMLREIVLESLDRIGAAAARVERHGMDVSIARTVWLELGGASELCKRFVLALQPHKREPERVMQARILGRDLDRVAQHGLCIGVAPKLAVEVCKIGSRRAIGGAQAQR